jgi:hypothetical protein
VGLTHATSAKKKCSSRSSTQPPRRDGSFHRREDDGVVNLVKPGCKIFSLRLTTPLSKHLRSSDPRISVAAATQILDRAYGRPVQSIDANITEDSGPVRYYAELP